MFLTLTTDRGTTGVGEVYAVPFHPDNVVKMIEDVFERSVAGQDPFKIERLWRIIYSSGYTQHPDLSVVGILSAIRLARRLEPYDPLWLEEPVPPENAMEMSRLAASTTIPIATGERLATKYEFARLLECKAASILQMNLGRVGGILEAKKIAGMAEAYYAQIAPHLYCGPVVGAANIHLSACSPNFLIQESIETFGNFHADILKKPILWQDGYIIPPKEPGLGVELDESVAIENPYTDSDLHLQVHEHPI